MKKGYILGGILTAFFLSGVLGTTSFAEVSNMAVSDKERLKLESEISGEGCTIESFSIFSKSMEREIRVVVILPPEYKAHPEKKYPILYTLHGGGAPYDTYSKMSPLRSALKTKQMIVTCFDGDRGSWFVDSPYLQKPKNYSNEPKKKDAPALPQVKSLFTTFFFEEFIPCVDKYYRVNEKQRMLTGFSMGSFGAFHYMLTKPAMFASVSSLSGCFSIDDGTESDWKTPVFGTLKSHPESYEAVNPFPRIKKYAEQKVKLPPVYLHCGTEDVLMDDNIKMNAFLIENGYSSSLEKSPGKHEWKFWVGSSAGIIDFHWKSLK